MDLQLRRFSRINMVLSLSFCTLLILSAVFLNIGNFGHTILGISMTAIGVGAGVLAIIVSFAAAGNAIIAHRAGYPDLG
jgi:hypothetical protein